MDRSRPLEAYWKDMEFEGLCLRGWCNDALGFRECRLRCYFFAVRPATACGSSLVLTMNGGVQTKGIKVLIFWPYLWMQIFWHWCRSCFFWHLVCTCGLTLQSALRGNRASATFQGILDLVDRFLLVLSPVSRCAVYSSTLIAIKLIFQLQPFCFATTVDVTGLLSSLLSLLAMNLLLETFLFLSIATSISISPCSLYLTNVLFFPTKPRQLQTKLPWTLHNRVSILCCNRARPVLPTRGHKDAALRNPLLTWLMHLART